MEERYSIAERIQHGWNAFRNKDPSYNLDNSFNPIQTVSSSYRPDQRPTMCSLDPTMINSIFVRIANDAVASTFEHIEIDDEGRYLKVVDSNLNSIFNLEANIDQTGQEFLLDCVMSMLDEGVVAVVPVDTSKNPDTGLGANDIQTMRVGKITNWMPLQLDVDLYNDDSGQYESVRVWKSEVAVLTNPFYEVMNAQNSTLKRLNRRLALLDITDERVASSKLDMLIQLPYSVRGETRKGYAENRREDIVDQLSNSKYGIGYIDSTERVIQLNRPIENQVMANVEYLTKLLFSQLGLAPEILNMTADEQTMTNYYKRIIDPINDTLTNEFRRKFLTKTARSQHQSIWSRTEPFKFTPTSDLAEIADKMIRNEVLTSNEVRQSIGYKPASDPRADMLVNPNMPQQDQLLPAGEEVVETEEVDTRSNVVLE